MAVISAAALAAWGGYVVCTDEMFAAVQLYALIPIYIVLVILSAFIDDFLHELAHLLVGLICMMGPKLPQMRILGSSSIAVYPYGSRHMKARMIATTSAGLIFDLLIIALGVVALAVPQVPSYLCVFLPYAFYAFFINVIPLEYKSGKTDGLVVWELVTDKPTAQVMIAILKFQGMRHCGTPLREIDESLLTDVPQLPEDDENFVILTQLRYEYYNDAGNESLAQKYRTRFKDLTGCFPEEYDAQ